MPLTLREAHAGQDAYRPSDPRTLDRLGETVIVPFVGASAAGKDYNMRLLGAHIVTSGTTREYREGDNGHMRYFTEDDMLGMIERGEVVQYAVIPEFGYLYATLADDYRPGINVKDVTHDAVSQFDGRGFAANRPIGVVAPAREFEQRFLNRFGELSDEKIRGRLAHAAITTQLLIDEWCLREDRLVIVSQKGHDVDNLVAMKEYIAHGTTDRRANLRALTVCRQMLQTIEQLQRRHAA